MKTGANTNIHAIFYKHFYKDLDEKQVSDNKVLRKNVKPF